MYVDFKNRMRRMAKWEPYMYFFNVVMHWESEEQVLEFDSDEDILIWGSGVYYRIDEEIYGWWISLLLSGSKLTIYVVSEQCVELSRKVQSVKPTKFLTV